MDSNDKKFDHDDEADQYESTTNDQYPRGSNRYESGGGDYQYGYGNRDSQYGNSSGQYAGGDHHYSTSGDQYAHTTDQYVEQGYQDVSVQGGHLSMPVRENYTQDGSMSGPSPTSMTTEESANTTYDQSSYHQQHLSTGAPYDANVVYAATIDPRYSFSPPQSTYPVYRIAPQLSQQVFNAPMAYTSTTTMGTTFDSEPSQQPAYSYRMPPAQAAHPVYRLPDKQASTLTAATTINVDNVGGDDNDAELAKLPRRPTIQNLQLSAEGILTIEVPVPKTLLEKCKYTDDKEFTHVKYTACTADADKFASSGYTLRQVKAGRQTELFIVVTMYNEPDDLFCKTMMALMKNIAYLCSRSRSSTWGADGWKKAVICIVSDGRTKINSRVLDVLGILGVYQNNLMKDRVNDEEVTAHIFEYTTQIGINIKGETRTHTNGLVPVQILFCLKEKNAKKINSHRWFFNAFGSVIKPNVCILIDVGTKPTNSSLYHLWKAFDRHPNVGGACGEIYAELGTGCSKLLNPLVAAQNFEYKMSNILDKPLESVFGYISVLPGAFSAYRFAAIQGVPLQQYFKGEVTHGSSNIFAANMYLAEDRILCFELVTKVKEAWVLRYVKAAKAETDVPAAVPEFISQRRRWLNGSFFASIHAISHWLYIFRSGHSFFRKILLCVEFVYNLINILFSWFQLGNFYLTFYFLLKDPITTKSVNVFAPLGPQPEWVFTLSREVYIMSLVLVYICSLGNRPQGSKFTYTVCMILFAAMMGLMLYITAFDVYVVIKDSKPSLNNIMYLFTNYPAFRNMCLSLSATVGLYFFASLIFLEPWHMFTSFAQYMFLLPSYVNILMVYAFCNLHDVSWGTKGDNITGPSLGHVKAIKGKNGPIMEVEAPAEVEDPSKAYQKFVKSLSQPRPKENSKRDAGTKQQDYFKNFRTQLILWWMFSNALLVAVLTSDFLSGKLFSAFGVNVTGDINPYLTFIFYSVLGISAVRFFGAITYLLQTLICG
ncbi:Chitin synthase, class 2 [Blyttiomyces sp. JEL0837]|nr:Chitin synthase, class 2 [Blyttiomyces sp. JEL0837]